MAKVECQPLIDGLWLMKDMAVCATATIAGDDVQQWRDLILAALKIAEEYHAIETGTAQGGVYGQEDAAHLDYRAARDELLGKADTKKRPECICTDSCDSPCKGECGCQACSEAYMDFLSCE